MIIIACLILTLFQSVQMDTKHPRKPRRRSSKRERRNTWHSGCVSELITDAEIRDKRAWAEVTFPGARLGREKTLNYYSRLELQTLKNHIPLRVLKQLVEEAELRDYRAKAEKLTPKGVYFGMKNNQKAAFVSNTFFKKFIHNYPIPSRSPSLYELVLSFDDSNQDNEGDDNVFDGLTSSRSEPGRRVKSDSELIRKYSKFALKVWSDITFY